MNDQQLIKIINKTLEEKLEKNFNYIRYSFYELRIKYNLSEDEIDRFLQLIRTKLENNNYKVYFTNAKYEYNGEQCIVKENELMIAIKN